MSETPGQAPRDLEAMLPEILSASGCCLAYCAREDVWPLFKEWLYSAGFLQGDEGTNIKAEFLLLASAVLAQVVAKLEGELITAKFEELLKTESEQ